MKKMSVQLTLLATLFTLASCGGGGSASSTYGAYTSPSILASEFVNALNSVDGTYRTSILKYANETLRSQVAGQDQWFVIYDAKYSSIDHPEYRAVSLQYIRSIVYYDYYSNNTSVAAQFRKIENSDILNTNNPSPYGDYWGKDYEVADKYVDSRGATYYVGKVSGYLYDEAEKGHDVNLARLQAEQDKILGQAAKISAVYSVSIEKALELTSMARKIDAMKARSGGNLSASDEAEVLSDMKQLTGVGLEEIQAAAKDPAKKAEVAATVAENLGSTEQKVLSLFGNM
jgi:hypothetical protein